MAAPFNPVNWMSTVDGNLSLYSMTIPGTHDTCALYGGDAAETQKATLIEQLQAGIRFIDIRCRHIDNVFTIHHGLVYEHINFGEGVLKVCLDFLAAHPSETIIMSVKQEYDPKDNTRTFEQTFDWYIATYNCHNRWYFGDTVPKLQDVRGKIVLFRRFDTDNPDQIKGLKAQPWPDNATFDIHNTAEMRIQDQYKVPTLFDRGKKWDKVKAMLDEARATTKQTLYVNFSSGTSSGCYPNAVASYVNPCITEYFLEHKQGRFGILVMDFESTARNMLIAHTNIPYTEGYWILSQNGGIQAYGNAVYYGHGKGSDNDAVDMATTPSGKGYWILSKNGGIHTYGDAAYYGHGKGSDNDAVAMAATPDGGGYWIVCKNGGIHSYGNAIYYGHGKGSDNDAVDIARTVDGKGYWILCKNGGIHSYGDAAYYGHGKGSDNDAVAMAITLNGGGYWILSKNGGIHTYGDAVYYGHGKGSDNDAVDIARTVDGKGYWILCENGGIHTYGDAPYDGNGADSNAVALCRS